jgi:DNA-binding NarL/FixJ family response regulator
MEEESGDPSLVLVDQHETLRDGLAVLLERRGFSVLGRANTAASGEELIAERHPDVAVVGVDLPDERGTELVRRLSERPPCPKFVIYTGLDDPDLLETAYRSGARGLVAMPTALSELVEALRKVGRGGRYFDRSFAQKQAVGSAAPKLLSRRESEILTMLAKGLTGEEIARRLVLSPETVRTHVRNAMEKLDARTRTHAVVKALDREEIHPA